MPQASTPELKPPAPAGAVVLVPGEKFFVRRVPLAPEGDAAAQVGLALEGLSPFPAAQLFYGFRATAARTQALVFAAYRKSFPPEVTSAWNDAAAVLPDFAVWLAGGTVPAAGIWVREHEGRVEMVAWDGSSELPAGVLVRPDGTGQRDALAAELRRKTGLPAEAAVKILKWSPVVTAREKRELIVRLADGGGEARFDEAALAHADVRDKAVLVERRQTLRRDTLLWRGFSALLVGLAACVVFELALVGARAWLQSRRRIVDAQAPLVQQIDAAQTMAKRLEDIATQRLLPLDMLAEFNDQRPKSVEYLTVDSKGIASLDIRAQCPNADDPARFADEVRKLAAIEQVDLSEQQAKSGMTTFRLVVTFKRGWFKRGGGA